MKSKVKGGGGVSFNMTPMIDIVFNLIIFFMLVSAFSQMQVEQVELPPAVKADPKKQELGEAKNIVINVVYVPHSRNPANNIIVDGKTLLVIREGPGSSPPTAEEMERLEEAIKAVKVEAEANDDKVRVIYRADERVKYDVTARVMAAMTISDVSNWWVQAYLPDPKSAADRKKMEELGIDPKEVTQQ